MDPNYKELLARIEALEAAQQQPTPMVVTGWQNMADPPAPAEGLVERVKLIIAKTVAAEKLAVVEPESWDGEARAVIREVAGWLRSQLISRAAADRLEQEAER